MSYRYRFYPPEIDDRYDDDFDSRQYSCYPVCYPNPACFPQTCMPSANYATCCPNPNSIYNIPAPVCGPYYGPSFCNPSYYHPHGPGHGPGHGPSHGCRPR